MSRESSTLGRAALIVSVGVLLSRVLGLVREQVIAALLGRSVEADLYVAAFTIPDYLFFLLAGGYLAITLVPILSTHHAAEDRDGLNVSFTAVFRVVAGISLALLAVGFAMARPFVEVVFSQLDPASIERLVPMTRIAIALQSFFALGALFAAAQYAERRFVIPALAPLVYNLGIIIGGLMGGAIGDPSPEAFLWGGLAGAVVGSFGMQWFGAHRLGIRLVRGTPLRHPAVGQYLKMAVPLMVGQSVVALDEQWPRLFGQLVDVGTISGLNFARRLNMLPIGVIAQAAGVASFPFMARLFADRRHDEMRRTVGVSLRSGVAVGALATALIAPITLQIVEVVFQYGRFEASDTTVVAGFLLIFSLSIPFWAAHQVLSRAFYAQRRMWVPVVVGTTTTLVVVPLLFLLTNAFGGRGIAIGSTLGIALYTIAIAAAWFRADRPAMSQTATHVSKVGLAAISAALGSTAALATGIDELPAVPSALVSVVLGTITFVLVARALGVAEVQMLIGRIRSRNRRSA